MRISSPRIGAWLRQPNRKRGDRTRAAHSLGVTGRSLTRWQGAAGPRKTGRPPHSPQALAEARPRVLAVLQTIGFKAGWPTIKAILQDLPKRIIDTVLKVLKAEHKAEQTQRIVENRIHTNVLAQGALLGQDSTHTGSCRSRKTWAEVLKDAATMEAWAFGNGKPITGESMLAYLEDLKARGLLPLVLATDNGSAYKEQRVMAWLAENKVIQLFSRPRTPTDNGRTERAIGEGKALRGLGKGVQHEEPVLGVQILDQALQTLTQHWPRSSKGGLTAAQLKQVLPHWQSTVSRSDFYEATCAAIKAIKTEDKRTRRKETREAIFRTLEQFGLILRTRGELKKGYVKPDRVS